MNALVTTSPLGNKGNSAVHREQRVSPSQLSLSQGFFSCLFRLLLSSSDTEELRLVLAVDYLSLPSRVQTDGKESPFGP